MDTSKFNLLEDRINQLNSKKIVYIGAEGSSGYATAAKGYIYDLIKRKHIIKYISYVTSNNDIKNTNLCDFDNLINNTKNTILFNVDEIIIHSLPEGWNNLLNNSNIKYSSNTKIIGRTVWEFESIPEKWVNEINNSVVNIVSVPTEWNKNTFIKCGVTKPIVVEPHVYVDHPYTTHTIDSIFKKSLLVNNNLTLNALDIENFYKFYNISQLTDRKGIDLLIETFCESFNISDNVILFLKLHRSDYSIQEQIETAKYIKFITDKYKNTPAILLIKDELSYDEIKSLHFLCDCYVTLTKTEGFGLGIFDAYNQKNKVIATGYGGHIEFLGKSYNGLVPFELKPVNYQIYNNIYLDDSYKWAIADKNAAIELLKQEITLSENKEVCKKLTINIEADTGFYNRETNIGNIARWTSKKAKFNFLKKIDNLKINIDIVNFNEYNKKILINNIEYPLIMGPQSIEINFTGYELDIECDKTFVPRIKYNKPDDRNLGVYIKNININNSEYSKIEIKCLNKIIFSNLKNININTKFSPSIINNKKIAILGYIPECNLLNNNLYFQKNLNQFKSYSNIFLFSEDDTWENAYKVENPISVVGKNKDRIGLWTFYKCLKIAKEYNLDYFLMIESDCRFFKDNWDFDLFDQCIKQNAYAYGSLNISNFSGENYSTDEINIINREYNFPCFFQGNVDNDNVTRLWTNGALTVYDAKIWFELLDNNIESILTDWNAWDYNCCKLIIDKFGFNIAKNKIIHANHIASNTEELVPLKFVLKNYKKFNAIHPVKTKWVPPKTDIYNVYHGGDFGDIIYTLPALKLLNNVNLILGMADSDNINISSREPFTINRYNFIKPLLEKINYINSINYSNDLSNIDININNFRYLWRDLSYRNFKKIDRLTDMFIDYCGVNNLFEEDKPWIVDIEPVKKSKFIISRSARYRDDYFPWNDILQKIKNECLFIGLDDEYYNFCELYGPVNRIKINDAFEMAQIIQGADLFIGNQSFPMSLAISMRKNIIQEYFKDSKDCYFYRDNFKTKENYKEIL